MNWRQITEVLKKQKTKFQKDNQIKKNLKANTQHTSKFCLKSQKSGTEKVLFSLRKWSPN